MTTQVPRLITLTTPPYQVLEYCLSSLADDNSRSEIAKEVGTGGLDGVEVAGRRGEGRGGKERGGLYPAHKLKMLPLNVAWDMCPIPDTVRSESHATVT